MVELKVGRRVRGQSRILWGLAVWMLCLGGLQGIQAEEVVEGPAPLPTFPVEDVTRGQKGWGLSVFAGSEPERFEVEVLGVVRQSTQEISYILARLTGKDLERIGVAAGMSGSPVYLDDRLAGAVAYSYPFGLDAIAGITPIAAMRKIVEPGPDHQVSTAEGAEVRSAFGQRSIVPSPWVEFEDLVRREFASDSLEKALGRLAPAEGDGRSAVMWTATGFGEQARSLLSGSLGGLTPLSGSGSGGGSVTGELGAGSAVAAVLVDGDLVMAAHGTVTERFGDEVLAFGHPLFSLGPLHVPMAHSEVITVLANASSSFKISNAGPIVGAFDIDREAGVRGRLGSQPRMTPLVVELAGLSERRYEMRVSELPALRPLMTGVATLGAMDAGSYSGGPQGVDLSVTYRLRGREDLELSESFDGDRAALDAVVYLMSFAGFLDTNAFAEVGIEGVDVRVEQFPEPRLNTLVAAHGARHRVEPGDRLAVHLDLVAWRGERFRRTVEVEIPETTPEGRYYLLLGDGSSMDSARVTIERTAPESLDQALAQMRRFRSRRQLVVFGLTAQPGVSVAGESLPQLPGSVRSIFAAAGTSPGAVPQGLAISHEQLVPWPEPLTGAVRIDLEVRRRPH